MIINLNIINVKILININNIILLIIEIIIIIIIVLIIILDNKVNMM